MSTDKTGNLKVVKDPAGGMELSISSLDDTIALFRSHQRGDGYWWYALEANETIGSEFIFLMHYLGAVDETIQEGIKNRILDVQRDNGTWAIYHDGPPCLSSTIECYFALRIAGVPKDAENMIKARQYIYEHGGIEKARVFTKIHLAMFGIVPWSAGPMMPSWFIWFPKWFTFNIYEFSSWARATIVPLLIFMTQRKSKKAPNNITLNELFKRPANKCDWSFSTDKSFFSLENFFIYINKILKIVDRLPLKPLRKISLYKASKWTWEHVKRTEDIYPAMAYCAFAFKAMGYSNDSPQIKKPFEALKMFHQYYTTSELPAMPPEIHDDGINTPSKLRERGISPFVGKQFPEDYRLDDLRCHQQCCISPIWDTPWMIMAMLESGVSPDDPALLKSGRWLLKKQIKDIKGDWSVKNRRAKPGGWAFEFENDYFPDVDDTIEILSVLNRLAIPDEEKAEAVGLGNDWMLSMQSSNGGWGAFDKDQYLEAVNRIPFSDHKACLDEPTADITGRMIEYFATQGYEATNPVIAKAIDFMWQTQEKNSGAWFGRWGINYIYGTWNALCGLCGIGIDPSDERIAKALNWLESIQRADGGWSESPVTYETENFSSYGVSIPSQTAWALMGLIAGGRARGNAARRSAEYLIKARNAEGGWDEMHYTGTGFEGHFYIRYHGYRHYFPLLALGRYFRCHSGVL